MFGMGREHVLFVFSRFFSFHLILLSQSRMCNSYGDVIKSYKFGTANLDLCSTLMAIEQWGFLACHTYCETGHLIVWPSWRIRVTQNYCRGFESRAVTCCLNELGLSQPLRAKLVVLHARQTVYQLSHRDILLNCDFRATKSFAFSLLNFLWYY